MGKEINTGIIHKGAPLSSEQITQVERSVLEQMASIAYINENEELCFALPVDVNSIKSFAWSTANQLTVEEGVFTKKVYTRTGIDTFDHTLTLTKASIDDAWGGGETPDEPVVTRAAGLYETGTDNMITSWDDLIANGVITVNDGNVKSNASSKLVGDLIISDSVTGVGRQAFIACSGLTSIVIPDSVTYLGDSVFWGCTSLTSIIISNNVKMISTNTFNGCINLTNVVIPDSVLTIDNAAFCNCSGLTSVVIGNGVTRIVHYAFDNCTALTDVYYTGTAEQWSLISIGLNGNDYLKNATIHYNYQG